MMENIRNLALFGNGEVMCWILRTLLHLGYQTTFSVLQAGHFGVAQSQRRLIIIAAAPGDKLPCFPEPMHVFPGRMFEEVILLNKRFFGTNMSPGAPRRSITTWDVISDLLRISSGNTVD